MLGAIAVKGHDAAVVGVVEEVGPEDFVAAEVVFLGGGKVAVTAVGVTVEEEEGICLLYTSRCV